MAIPSGLRECAYALRFGPARIKASESARLQMVCNDRFRPVRILMSPDVAERLKIISLLVIGLERNQLFMVPGKALAGWLRNASIEPGWMVVIEVENVSKIDTTFWCGLMGTAVVEIREKGSSPTYLDRTKTPRFSRKRR